MPISHKHKCIFVHIPKNGGTSIEHALDMNIAGVFPAEDRDKLYGWISSEDLKSYGFKSPVLQHLTANEINKIVAPEIFNNYFKFAIIRNPWERMLSQYLFKKDLELLFNANKKEDVSFDKYLKNLDSFIAQEQYEYITDENGNILVDYIGRLENLETDFKIICKKLGLSELVLSVKNKTKHTHYSSYYSEETQQIVQDLFKNDIEMFDFKFERKSRFTKRRKYKL